MADRRRRDHRGEHHRRSLRRNLELKCLGWGSIVRSRLDPALEDPISGAVIEGKRWEHHWQILHGHAPGKTFTETGMVRGYVDKATHKFYDAKAAGLDTTELRGR